MCYYFFLILPYSESLNYKIFKRNFIHFIIELKCLFLFKYSNIKGVNYYVFIILVVTLWLVCLYVEKINPKK